uniref:Uncharacterized protein n=1 Tax=Oryza glumipatula TaxID=40148 RepID=A0A0E0B394_9ORYZ
MSSLITFSASAVGRSLGKYTCRNLPLPTKCWFAPLCPPVIPGPGSHQHGIPLLYLWWYPDQLHRNSQLVTRRGWNEVLSPLQQLL